MGNWARIGSHDGADLHTGVELRCFEIDHGFVRVLKERLWEVFQGLLL